MRELGLVFDRVAEAYDRARPSYPPALVDAACAFASLHPGSRVVEVGCGTGKLTEALAERALAVEAVDPGAQLVSVARRRVRATAVRFHLSRFEDVDLPADAFDALFSATAFHWVDPAVGWTKAASLLRPGGALALLAHVGGTYLELDDAMLAAWREVLPEAESWERRDPETIWRGAEERRGNVSELWSWLVKSELARPEAAELFGEAEIVSEPVDETHTADELIALVRTQSSYLKLDPGRQEQLERRLAGIVAEAGGALGSTTFATLVVARRRRSLHRRR